MAGDKLRTMKEAVNAIIDLLAEDDIISIVAFESKPHLLVEARTAKDKPALRKQVDKIKDGGGTKIAPALQEALAQINKYQSSKRVNRIILLTDGEATDTLSDSFHIADQAGQSGFPIIALGLGEEWKEDFLFELADRSIHAPAGSRTGLVDYIPEAKQVAAIFHEVYQSMQIVARDIILNIRMVQGVEAKKVWQVRPFIKDISSSTIQGQFLRIEIGYLERAGAAYLAEIMLPPRQAGVVRVAQSEVIFRSEAEETLREITDLVITYTDDQNMIDNVNERVMNVVEKVQAFKLQNQALDDVQQGELSHATRKLRQAVTILLSQGEVDLANQIEQEVKHLEQTGAISSKGKKTIMLTSRKTVRLEEE